MTYISDTYKNRWNELENFYESNENKNMNWHTIRTIMFWILVGIIGGLQALAGHGIGDLTTIISILGIGEHLLNGNTSYTS